MTLAAVFPGQGAQRLGMARDFHDAFAESRRTFAEASEALGFDVAKLCFQDAERLTRTEFQQPAILTAELAILAALRAQFAVEPAWLGGHSLGEYAALAAAGVMDVGTAAKLVHERGKVMQEAVPLGEGSMTAVWKPDLDVARLRALLEESDGIELDIANHNSPDQVVLSGNVIELARATERIKADEAFARGRCIPLRVSAPFHSRLMRPAAERFRPLLEEASRTWDAARAARVVSNTTGVLHEPDRAAIVDALTRQIYSPVRWLDCMAALRARASRIVEIGPGRILTGFFKSMGVVIESISDMPAAARAFSS